MLQPQHPAAPSAAASVNTDVISAAQRLLQQGRPEDAFLTAKQALDASMPDDEGTTCQLWSLMGRSLEALGTVTAAYSLVMKGAERMQGRAARQLLASQAVGLLATLSSRGLHAPDAPAAPEPGLGLGSSCRQLPAGWAPEPCRIHCLSDVHVDRPGGRNIQALRSISSTAFQRDVLLVAGDLGDTLAAVRLALETLRPRFRRLVFVPGNHDLWLRPGSWDARHFPDSFCKLWAILDLCKELGVDTGPLELPIQDTNTTKPPPDGPGHYLFDAFCKWPVRDLDVWQVMLHLNAGVVSRVHACLKDCDKEGSQGGTQPGALKFGSSSLRGTGAASSDVERSARLSEQRPLVISMSHFLPHTELPFSPFQPELAKAVGCAELQAQMEEVRADVHVYGHSHVNVDVVLDDVNGRGSTAGRRGRGRRYIQHALEAQLGGPSLYTIWDGHKLVGQRTACADGKPLAAP